LDKGYFSLAAINEMDILPVEEGIFLGTEIDALTIPFGHLAVSGEFN
jgi:hypothetical protein